MVYLVFKCYRRQICYTQLSKPSPKLRSWAPVLVHDATVKKFKVCSPRNNIFSSLKIPNKFETHIVETVWCLHILRYISVESTWKSLQWIKCRIRKINLFFVHNNFTTSLLPTNYQMSKLEIEQFYPCQIKINLLYTLTKTDNDFFCNFPFQDSVLIRGRSISRKCS